MSEAIVQSRWSYYRMRLSQTRVLKLLGVATVVAAVLWAAALAMWFPTWLIIPLIPSTLVAAYTLCLLLGLLEDYARVYDAYGLTAERTRLTIEHVQWVVERMSELDVPTRMIMEEGTALDFLEARRELMIEKADIQYREDQLHCRLRATTPQDTDQPFDQEYALRSAAARHSAARQEALESFEQSMAAAYTSS